MLRDEIFSTHSDHVYSSYLHNYILAKHALTRTCKKLINKILLQNLILIYSGIKFILNASQHHKGKLKYLANDRKASSFYYVCKGSYII